MKLSIKLVNSIIHYVNGIIFWKQELWILDTRYGFAYHLHRSQRAGWRLLDNRSRNDKSQEKLTWARARQPNPKHPTHMSRGETDISRP